MTESETRLQQQLAAEIGPYRPLLEAFVSDRISQDEFETQFGAMWDNDDRNAPEAAFAIFEEFFFVVEDYVDDESLRDPANGDLGPAELKAKARELLQRAGFEPPSAD